MKQKNKRELSVKEKKIRRWFIGGLLFWMILSLTSFGGMLFIVIDGLRHPNVGPHASFDVGPYPKPKNRYLLDHGVWISNISRITNTHHVYIKNPEQKNILNVQEYAWQESEYDTIYFKNIDGVIYLFDIKSHEVKLLKAKEFNALGLEWYPIFESAS